MQWYEGVFAYVVLVAVFVWLWSRFPAKLKRDNERFEEAWRRQVLGEEPKGDDD